MDGQKTVGGSEDCGGFRRLWGVRRLLGSQKIVEGSEDCGGVRKLWRGSLGKAAVHSG